MGDTVTWFHRTVEQYVGALVGAGFTLTALRQCAPEPGRFGGDEAELSRKACSVVFAAVSPSHLTPPQQRRTAELAKVSNAWLILAYHEVGENIGGGTYTTDIAVLDADMKAVKDSGLGIVTVAQGAAEVLSRTSRN